MSVKIRLSRHGAKKRPYYRIVVADARDPRDGRFIEQVGTYDPRTPAATLKLDQAKVNGWIEKGAQPTQTVRNLIKRAAKETGAVAESTEAAAGHAEATESAAVAEIPAVTEDAAVTEGVAADSSTETESPAAAESVAPAESTAEAADVTPADSPTEAETVAPADSATQAEDVAPTDSPAEAASPPEAETAEAPKE